MDAVSLPPEDAEIYIPTINGVETTGHDCHPVQLPAICYTPAIAAAGQPLVAARAANGHAIVADNMTGAPILQGIQYRTTFCTQVQFAHTTFHYPPTPPVEAPPDVDKLHSGGEAHMMQQQAALESDPGLEKAAFPSGLPTPPDLEAIQCVEEQHSPDELSVAHSVSANFSDRSKAFSATSHWAGQPSVPQPANVCFMPAQQQMPFSASGPTSNSMACRPIPPSQPTAVYYQMQDSTLGGSRKMPALVKDASCKCVHVRDQMQHACRTLPRASCCANWEASICELLGRLCGSRIGGPLHCCSLAGHQLQTPRAAAAAAAALLVLLRQMSSWLQNVQGSSVYI